ncbi:hypothetical protein [Novosphingopyxis sp. YJ-S2-01]|uniref:hypothetical protein n=1 Tax=Novosphingopyxis sp. YJ-S2-01 TaxID=2794021 RepID=UPI0018DC4AE5|nr:hypothetical protein [Novosphingopyxis sp. YJ-S2-01]MBH9537549.1 hypothetical protein [Novosphingopyxis sp. YJ-S2-01]
MSDLLHILQHSRGVDQYGQGERYRNSFFTGPETDDHPLCMEAVERGLMWRRAAPDGFGGMDFFAVTDEGDEFITRESPAPPKLTAGQKRYRAYLDADCDLSFGDWLRRRSRPA